MSKKAKKWGKKKKNKKLKNLKISLKRKSKAECTTDELEMIYGYPDWDAMKADQEKD